MNGPTRDVYKEGNAEVRAFTVNRQALSGSGGLGRKPAPASSGRRRWIWQQNMLYKKLPVTLERDFQRFAKIIQQNLNLEDAAVRLP